MDQNEEKTLSSEEKTLSFEEKTIIIEDSLKLSKGIIIQNISELIKEIENMNEETFSHYVSKSNNVFADWILEGLNNEKLSKKIRKIKNKEKLVKKLKSYSKIKLKDDKTKLKDDKIRLKNNKLNVIKIPNRKKDILNSLSKIDDKIN